MIEYIKNFFRNEATESMTRVIALIVTLSGVVYMVKTWDATGTCSIFLTSGAIKVGGKRIAQKPEKNE